MISSKKLDVLELKKIDDFGEEYVLVPRQRRDEILIASDVSCVKVALCKPSMEGSHSIT